MTTNSDTAKNAKRQLRRRIGQCRSEILVVRRLAESDPARRAALLAVIGETERQITEAERLLTERIIS